MKIGYSLMCEEHPPKTLVENAARAEKAGFEFCFISDHFHPWLDVQGQSPFVWNVLGALSQATQRIEIGTAVTCPTFRYHPAIVAQAAATSASMLEGRFFLGLGSGEALNEHIVAKRWPATDIRLEMLEESIDILRQLLTGEEVSHYGQYFSVENARIYTLPEKLPPIYVAGGGKKAISLAANKADGLICLAPSKSLLEHFDERGGRDKPRYGQMVVCYHESRSRAEEIAYKYWPQTGVKGELKALLPNPAHFEQACKMVSRDDVFEKIVCGPDPSAHLEMIDKYRKAGYTGLSIHQVGPDQASFIDFYHKQILTEVGAAVA
ncbi:MAG: TIGR03557 family F420-dependent LLM class oxidoreductase [Vulcanimicrobiota bacterium]